MLLRAVDFVVAEKSDDTLLGLARKSYPRLGVDLTLETAREIYARDYWRPIRGDQLPPAIAWCVFDYATQSTVATAVQALQRAVGVRPDGVVGPITVGASRTSDLGSVVRQINDERLRLFLLSPQTSVLSGTRRIARLNYELGSMV